MSSPTAWASPLWGGWPASAVATLLANLDKPGRDRSGGGGIEPRLRAGFAAAHAQVLAVQTPQVLAVSTATVLYWPRGSERAWVGHVGDTTAHRLRGGRLELLTQIHDCIGVMAAHEGVTRDEMARRYVWRNVLVYALGMEGAFPGPEVLTVPLAAGDRLLLSSDGVYNLVFGEELARLLGAEGSPQERAERLCERALENGGRDNVSAVIVDVVQGR